MTDTQVPIIGWEKRYMTPKECARLQSLESLAQLPASPVKAFEALGNAVNATVVEKVARCLLSNLDKANEPSIEAHLKKVIEPSVIPLGKEIEFLSAV